MWGRGGLSKSFSFTFFYFEQNLSKIKEGCYRIFNLLKDIPYIEIE